MATTADGVLQTIKPVKGCFYDFALVGDQLLATEVRQGGGSSGCASFREHDLWVVLLVHPGGRAPSELTHCRAPTMEPANIALHSRGPPSPLTRVPPSQIDTGAGGARLQLLEVGTDGLCGEWGDQLPLRLQELHSHWFCRWVVAWGGPAPGLPPSLIHCQHMPCRACTKDWPQFFRPKGLWSG